MEWESIVWFEMQGLEPYTRRGKSERNVCRLKIESNPQEKESKKTGFQVQEQEMVCGSSLCTEKSFRRIFSPPEPEACFVASSLDTHTSRRVGNYFFPTSSPPSGFLHWNKCASEWHRLLPSLLVVVVPTAVVVVQEVAWLNAVCQQHAPCYPWTSCIVSAWDGSRSGRCCWIKRQKGEKRRR